MPIASPRLRADLILLLVAAIWGLSFVAQRLGTQYLGPFTFNAIRFFIGSILLLPVARFLDRRRHSAGLPVIRYTERRLLAGGVLAGLVLFAAATFQQTGITSTTAGKAGFITSLYVVLVPLLGLALGLRPSAAVWLGAVLAAVGLYFLTIESGFRMSWGDLLVLAGAFMWAAHFLVLGRLSPRTDPVKLAYLQFLACAALSAIVALLIETTTFAGLLGALGAILFSGVLSVGVGYTLQVVAQRDAPPADTAIILSLEAPFAVLGGVLLLGEQLTTRALLGCAFMLAGILVSQFVGRDATGPGHESAKGSPQPTEP
jgi:drug/metabolite transporter (DMT)-like permease